MIFGIFKYTYNYTQLFNFFISFKECLAVIKIYFFFEYVDILSQNWNK